MAQTDSIIALDVNKDRLDGLDADTGEVFQVENSVSGWALPGSDRQIDPVQERLAELATYRRQLLDEQTMVATQAETRRDPELRRLTARRLASLKAQLVRLDKPIAEHIEASPPLADRARLLHSRPRGLLQATPRRREKAEGRYRRRHVQARHHGKRADPRSARLRRMKHSCLAPPQWPQTSSTNRKFVELV